MDIGELDPSSPPWPSFPGPDDDGSRVPPDPQGAVGRDQLLIALNTEVAVQDRQGELRRRVGLAEFWTPLQFRIAFDPRATYDADTGRFFLVTLGDNRSSTSSVMIAVSEPENAAGVWQRQKLAADPSGELWADYPSIGTSPRYLAVQLNLYRVADNSFGRSDLYLFDKLDLAGGGSGEPTVLSDSTLDSAQVPASVLEGDDTLFLVRSIEQPIGGKKCLEILRVEGARGSERLVQVARPCVDEDIWQWAPPNEDDLGPQLGSSARVQLGDDRIQTAVRRGDRLYVTQTVFLPGAGPASRAAVQWWVLSTNGDFLERGILDDPTGSTMRAYPSLGVNAHGDMVLGYSLFSAHEYASAAYSSRLAGDSAFGAEVILKAGEAPYLRRVGSWNRWGDFSSTVVDPRNESDLWTFQPYAATAVDGLDRFGTWWGRIVPRNQAPGVSALEILPKTPRPGDALIASYAYSDADGHEELGSRREWFLEGAVVPELGGAFAVPAGRTRDGERWRFRVTPSDGMTEGPEAAVEVLVSGTPRRTPEPGEPPDSSESCGCQAGARGGQGLAFGVTCLLALAYSRVLRLRRAIAIAALTACVPSTVQPSSAGGFTFWTIIDATTRKPVSVGTKSVVSVEPGQELVFFEAPHDAFLDGRGEVLSDELVPELRADLSCGCSAFSREPPMRLYPGDACPLPPFLEPRLEDGARPSNLADLTESISLVRRGLCERARPSIGADRRTVMPEFVWPTVDPLPVDRIVLASDRSIFLFSEHQLVRIPALGPTLLKSRFDGVELPFRGPTRAVAEMPDGRVLASYFDPSTPLGFAFYAIDQGLEATPISLPVSERNLVYQLAWQGNRLLIALKIGFRIPGVAVCRLEGTELDCDVRRARYFRLGAPITEETRSDSIDRVASSSAWIVGTTIEHEVAIGRLEGLDELELKHPEEVPMEDDRGLPSISIHEDSIFVCFPFRSESWVLRTTGPLAHDGWTVVGTLPGACAEGLALPDGRNGFLFDDGRLYRCDDGGCIPDSTPMAPPGFRVVKVTRTSTAILTPAGQVFRNGELVHGAPEQVGPVYAVAGAEDGFVAIGSRPDQWLRFDPSTQLVRVEAVDGFESTDRIHAIVARHDGWLAVGESERAGFIRVVEEGRARELAESMQLPPLFRVVEAGRGTFIAAGASFGMFMIEGATVTWVRVDWDDPETAVVDSAPSDPCYRDDLVETEAWLSLSSAGGLVWAGGCGGALARVEPKAARAQRIELPDSPFFTRRGTPVAARLPASALKAYGAGDLFVAIPDPTSSYDLGRFVGVSMGRSHDRLDGTASEHFANPPADSTISEAPGSPVAVLGPSHRPTVVTGPGEGFCSIQQLGSTARIFRPGTCALSVAESQAGSLVGSDSGHLIWLEPE